MFVFVIDSVNFPPKLALIMVYFKKEKRIFFKIYCEKATNNPPGVQFKKGMSNKLFFSRHIYDKKRQIILSIEISINWGLFRINYVLILLLHTCQLNNGFYVNLRISVLPLTIMLMLTESFGTFLSTNSVHLAAIRFPSYVSATLHARFSATSYRCII